MANEKLFFDVKKTNAFFSDLSSAIDDFAKNAINMQTSLDDFSDSDSFKGNEAQAAKTLSSVYETDLLNELLALHSSVQTLMSDLLTEFSTTVDADASAYISEADLETINKDFKGYYATFKTTANAATSEASSCSSAYSKYGTISSIDLTQEKKDFKNICGGLEDDKGYIYKCIQKLKTFDSNALTIIENANLDSQCVSIADKMQLYRSKGNDYDEASARQILDICQKLVDGGSKTDYDTMVAEAILGVKPYSILTMGDPINMSTGNYIYDTEDLKIEGEIPVSFHRFYNSIDTRKSSLGQGFRHNYEIGLEVDKELVRISLSDGETHNFRRVDNVYVSMGNAVESLEKIEGGFALKDSSANTMLFDESGKLSRLEDKNGRGIRFVYNSDNLLLMAASDNGDSLEYKYDFDGRLIVVEDSAKRKLLFFYEGDCLSKVKRADGTVVSYIYNENGGITALVNSRDIDAVKNVYDDKNRVLEQKFIDGGVIKLIYDDANNTVSMIEQNGVKTTCIHDERGRNIKNIYFDGTTETFEYNEQNRCVYKKDRNGNVTRMAYDNRGNMTQIIEPDGKKTNITIDAKGNVTAISVNGKNRVKNSYDSKGNCIKSVNALNEEIGYEYDSCGRAVKIVRAHGETSNITYDLKGNIMSITDPSGSCTTYEYDALNRVVKTIDGNNNETAYEYDVNNNLTAVHNAVGDTRSYAYASNGQLVKLTDYDGQNISMEYNGLGKLTKYTDKAGFELTYSYDMMQNVSKVTNPDGGTTTFEYDENNRLKSKTNPLGGKLSFSYDPVGNLVEQTNTLGAAITNSYDACNRLVETKFENGLSTKYFYDELGQVIKVEDAKGQTVCYEYDELGRKKAIINEQGLRTEYTYGAYDQITKIEGPVGYCQTFEYDACGRIIAAINPDQTKEYTRYDNNGNVVSKTNGTGDTVSFIYDALNRVSSITNQLGGVRTFEYDAVGKITKIVDENGGISKYEYDANSNLTRTVDAAGNITEYTYDSMGNLLKSIAYDKDGKEPEINTYSYDKAGNVVEAINPLGQLEQFKYDVFGNLVEKQDAEGFNTDYSYDKDGLLKEISYADGRSIRLSYDALNQLEKMQDWLGTTSFKRNELGQPVSVEDVFGNNVKYQWTGTGDRKSITYPDGEKIDYGYDEKHQLVSLSGDGTNIVYEYDGNGRITAKKYSDGTTTTYAYNKMGAVSEICHSGVDIAEKISFTYDMAGNKIEAIKNRPSVPEDNGVFSYRYDALNRLTEVSKDGQLVNSYEYDAFSNRTKKNDTTFKYNLNNELIKETNENGTTEYSYDKRGNLISKKLNDVQINSFSYDAGNFLISAADIANSIVSDYSYNGFGKRVTKATVKGNEQIENIEYTLDYTRQYYDLLSSKNKAKSASMDFFWDGNVAAMKTKGMETLEDYYFLQDDLGSPMAIAQGGKVKEHYAYDEFGNNIIDAGRIFDTRQPFGFTGYQNDTCGLYYAQARRYDSNNGRFTSRDFFKGVIEAPYTFNAYSYCWNNPLSLLDLNGMLPDWAKTAIKITAAVAITAAVVVAAPYVAAGVATAAVAVGVSSTVAAGVATVATAAVAGATISATTEVTNELVDTGKVNGKKVAVSAGNGFLKGAIGGAMAVAAPAGIAGAALTKGVTLASNVGLDIGRGYIEHKIDGQVYTKGDAFDDGVTSAVSTVMGWGIGALGKGLNKVGNNWLRSHRWQMDAKTAHQIEDILKNSTGDKNVFEALKNALNTMTESEKFYYVHVELEEVLRNYIVDKAINYDKGLVRNTILKMLNLSSSDIEKYISNAIAKADCRYACK